MEIHYFDFEKDFVEDGLRCIPLLVRMKLDAVGIKLSLRQWSMLDEDQRDILAAMPVKSRVEKSAFDSFLSELIASCCDEPAVRMAILPYPAWKDKENIPEMLLQQANIFKTPISLDDWKLLRPLQRFALIKLSRPGHENRNFPLAIAEFGLIKKKEVECAETN